jgi:transcriptional regulator with XRE-family HTH domain
MVPDKGYTISVKSISSKEDRILQQKRILSVQKTFNQHAKSLRKQQGLTMSALARRIGVTPSYISLIESGVREPSRLVVLRMAEAFFGPHAQYQTDELLMMAGLSPICYAPRPVSAEEGPRYPQQRVQDPQNIQALLTQNRKLIRHQAYKTVEPQIFQSLKQFHQGLNFQLLMAQMQLCVGAHAMANSFLQDALEAATHTATPLTESEQAELQAHLGLTYLLWSGVEPTAEQTEANQPTQDKLAQAEKHYQQALKLCPTDIQLQDEYAHVCFERAERQGLDPLNWQIAVNALDQVICSPQVEELDFYQRRETNTRLVWALGRAGQIRTAHLLLNLLRHYYPDYHPLQQLWGCVEQVQSHSDHTQTFNQILNALIENQLPAGARDISPPYNSLKRLRENTSGSAA